MDAATAESLKRKFEVAYMITKEKMAFTKMKHLCELEEQLAVDLGFGYKNDQACTTFMEFIALENRKSFTLLIYCMHKCYIIIIRNSGN